MLALLEKAEARVHLDARHPGVILPPRLQSERHLMLDYAYGFSPPIPDLVVDDLGVHATLSFSRIPTKTFIPWEAIYLIADFEGNGAVWHEDVPPDLVAALEMRTQTAPALANVPADATAQTPRRAEEDRPKKPRPNHLKLVK